MNENETPLLQIIWHRLAKYFDEPPMFTTEEKQILNALKRNRLAICKALLVTLGAFLIFQLHPPDLRALWKWMTTKLPGFENHWPWYAAGVLFFAAAQAHWICSAGLRVWRHCIRTRFALIVALVGVGLACGESNSFLVTPQWPFPPREFIGWAIFFVSLTCLFWTSKELSTEVKDRLQRAYFVERLLGCFKNPDTSLRRIAVMGGWGTGKTVVLKLLRQALLGSTNPRYGVVMINPWVSQNIEEVHVMITRAFEEALGYRDYFENPMARSRWASFLTSLKFGGNTELGFDLQQLFRGGLSSREDELVQRINDTLRSSGRVCVILVDDMERAEPEVIRRVFPLIDLFRRIEHCFFVFGIDPMRVARAFKERSANGEQTKGYLDKVFDLQLNLPQSRPKDIANMCMDMVNPQDTPKLHAAWSAIAPHLPVTPREAIHFVRDAIMRETLFLSRYGPEEHDYVGFFKLRLLGMELPGLIDRLDNQHVEEYRSAKYGAFLMQSMRPDLDKQTQEKLSKAWDQIKGNIAIPTSKESRLKALFEQVLSSNVDWAWACHHHMRLLALNEKQRHELKIVWQKNAGKKSILEMITLATPGICFDDQDKIALQLLETESDNYRSLRDKLIGEGSPAKASQLLADALECIGKLIAHAGFAHTSSSELEFYPPDAFSSWIQVVFRGRLNDTCIDTSSLRQREVDYSIALASILSTHDAYQFARWPTKSIIYQHSMGEQRDELVPHMDTLKASLQKRLYGEFSAHIRSGHVAQRSFPGMLGAQHLAEIFGDLESWNPYSDNLNTLRSLETEIQANPQIAVSMAAIVTSLFQAAEYIARTSDGDRVALARRTFTDHPNYVALLWQMALQSPNDRDDLLSRHAYTRKATNDTTVITTDRFDQAFPIDRHTVSYENLPRH